MAGESRSEPSPSAPAPTRDVPESCPHEATSGPRCTEEPCDSFQHPFFFGSQGPFDFRILGPVSSAHAGNIPGQDHRNETKQNSLEASVPSSGPSLTSSPAHCPFRASWGVSEAREGVGRGGRSAGSAHGKGLLGSWPRFSLTGGLLLSTARPVPEDVLGMAGLGQMEKHEEKAAGADGSASVCPGVNAALGAFHVLFPGEEGGEEGELSFPIEEASQD